jgi:hypothetical protein
MKNLEIQFCAQRVEQTPTSQDCGFPFRRASEAIKRVLTASTRLLFLNQTGNETPILTFS